MSFIKDNWFRILAILVVPIGIISIWFLNSYSTERRFEASRQLKAYEVCLERVFPTSEVANKAYFNSQEKDSSAHMLLVLLDMERLCRDFSR